MEIKTNKQVSKALFYVSVLAFVIFAIYLLFINQEVFYTVHNRSEFLYGAPFWQTLLSKPFGLMQYIGAWLTQLFYYPALGAGVLIALWVLIFVVGVRAFRLQGHAAALMLLPVACLLTSVVDLGYWIYILPIRGYFFSQSVAYLVMLLLLWVARCAPRQWHLVWYLLGVCLYPVLGWFALLFVVCLVLTEKLTWRELVGIVMLLFTANIWRALLYDNTKLDAVMMAGFPLIENILDSSSQLNSPFWLLGLFSLLFPLCAKYLNRVYVPVLCVAAGIVFTASLMFTDKTYMDEMRMVRSAESDNWQEVLTIAAENAEPTASMVMLKNVALMNEGGLLDQSFKMNGNKNYPVYNPDSLHISLLEVSAPLVYYNYGLINEAIRLNYENAIQEGLSPFYLKLLIRCTQATGETNLMKRFLTILHHHPFYANWQPAPVSEKVRELQTCYPDEITGVENSDSYVVNSISLWYKSESKLAAEQSLFYSMIRCDSRRFWPSLRHYFNTHGGEAFPVHAQEAYIMFIDKSPEEKRMMVPVEQPIYDRYKLFWEELETYIEPGVKIGDVAVKMRKDWGDTYWYYNIFGRKAY